MEIQDLEEIDALITTSIETVILSLTVEGEQGNDGR